jgi:hypothetical protein
LVIQSAGKQIEFLPSKDIGEKFFRTYFWNLRLDKISYMKICNILTLYCK